MASRGLSWAGLGVTMISHLDLYPTATVLVDRYGEVDTPVEAAMWSAAMLEAGDLEGYGTWKGILEEVEESVRLAPVESERVNGERSRCSPPGSVARRSHHDQA